MAIYHKRAQDVDSLPAIEYVYWQSSSPYGVYTGTEDIDDEVVIDYNPFEVGPPLPVIPSRLYLDPDFVWYSAVDEDAYLVKATQPTFTNQTLTSATGWTKAATITISGGFAAWNSGGEQNMYQAVGIGGNRYASNYTVSSFSSGGIRPFMGSGNPAALVTSNGAKESESLTSTDTLLGWNTRGDIGGVLSISSISMINLSRTRWNPVLGVSGNIGGYLSNATAAQQPWSGVRDGYDGFLVFDGTAKNYRSSLAITPWSFLTKTATPASVYFIANHHTVGWSCLLCSQILNATGIGLLLYLDTDGKYAIDIRNGTDVEQEIFTAPSAITLNEIHLIEYHKDASDNVYLILNGETILSDTCTIFANQTPNQSSMIVGYNPSTTKSMYGDIMMYNGALTDDEKAEIREYLMTKHGIE